MAAATTSVNEAVVALQGSLQLAQQRGSSSSSSSPAGDSSPSLVALQLAGVQALAADLDKDVAAVSAAAAVDDHGAPCLTCSVCVCECVMRVCVCV
jgi:hypothetical protein